MILKFHTKKVIVPFGVRLRQYETKSANSLIFLEDLKTKKKVEVVPKGTLTPTPLNNPNPPPTNTPTPTHPPKQSILFTYLNDYTLYSKNNTCSVMEQPHLILICHLI